ncbi:hypothetical protein BDV96DRAFT_636934 [Lophiotrema nucula]|uniref:Zn(2)-C6 fungal-type domain-containing protein n=1 Tax=Lophiotrema nucula TaxID=690887 RepID=A0A6A5YMN7_9PLEO|nr:hypothetical protein BDV96DRAFT_636934 [Lophiotrema nucula]
MPSIANGTDRKRRAHAKSRKGCGNCKLRRVKCDEGRPQCSKCVAYGVSCNYDTKTASLDLSAQGSFQVDLTQKVPPKRSLVVNESLGMPLVSTNKTVLTMIAASLDESEARDGFGANMPWAHRWTFTEADLRILKKFQERTVLTMGTKRTAPAYRDCIATLAFQQPFLMHMLLCLTLLHDADLARPYDERAATKSTHLALQHWSTATKLYSEVLSKPIQPHVRDSLWATASMMGCSTFAYIESPDVREAWPLKPPDPNDLDWLKLSEGKKAIWELANPSRPDSVFKMMAQEHHYLAVPKWVEENDLSGLSQDMRDLFDIGPDSTVQNNVYHLPALILSQLQFMKPDHDNVLNFLYFMGYMTPEFRNLLEIKDPRALLLVGWWFKRLNNAEIWWLRRRASVEGESVRIWLDRWYGGETGLKEMFEKLGKTHPSNVRMPVDQTVPEIGWFRPADAEMQCPAQ